MNVDVLVIGGGAAGMAAATAAAQAGARTQLLERSLRLGGVLDQCIHPGFGLHRYNAELTGPEFAHRQREELYASGAQVCLGTEVIGVDARARQVRSVSPQGVHTIVPKALVWAAGARERPLGALQVPGSRPSGVYVAGLAQRMVNIHGLLPGRRAVVLGSGDIGLIMARRLHLEGTEVAAVLELKPFAGGLLRNVVQCLDDFGIPLLLEHTVIALHGRRRLEGVTVAAVDGSGRPRPETQAFIEADTLILSVGLIPETELVPFVERDPGNRGPAVNARMQTDCPWVFAAGNCTVIYDLVDTVAASGAVAGEQAAHFALGRMQGLGPDIRLSRGENVAHMVPTSLSPGVPTRLSLRVPQPLGRARVLLAGREIARRPGLRPSEMLEITISHELIAQLDSCPEAKLEVIPL